MPQGRLEGLLDLIHGAHILATKCDNTNARKTAVQAAKIVASLEPSLLVKSLSRYVLDFHALLTGPGLLLADRLAWTASHIGPGIMCPPVLIFPNGFTSHDRHFVSSEVYRDNDRKLEAFPNHQLVPFEEVVFESWEDGIEVASSLSQDLLTNCSMVSSMVSVASSSAALKLVQSISPNTPAFKYRVKLYFNGRWRLVTVDSRLPQPWNGRVWHVLAIVKWPALIEKAILKVMGEGYSFAGSNMAIDTFMMTGWIPEIVSIESTADASSRILEALALRNEGKALVGMGTGSMSALLQQDVGLASDHDYSLVNYDRNRREATLRNPWSGPKDAFERAPLSFIKHFYINWNPSMFEYCDRFDCVCPGITTIDKSPQLVIANPYKTPRQVWLLLERHLPSPRDIRIQLVIYQTKNGERVLAKGQYAACDGQATCNRTQLVKVSVPPMSCYTAAIFCSSKGSVTITAYSNGERSIPLSRARSLFATVCPDIHGEWSLETCGGNVESSRFVDNPQYTLEVRGEPVNAQLALFSDEEIAVATHIVVDTCRTPYQLTDFDSSTQIGQASYTLLVSVRQLQLLPGKYRIVVATYAPNVLSSFRLHLNHDGKADAVTLTKIMPVISLFKWDMAFGTSRNLQSTVTTTRRGANVIVRARCYDHSNALVPATIRIEGHVASVTELHSKYGDSLAFTVSEITSISVFVDKGMASSGLVTINSDTELEISQAL